LVVCCLAALVAAGLGLAAAGLLAGLGPAGLGPAGLLAATGAKIGGVLLKRSTTAGREPGIGLELRGTNNSHRGTSLFIFMVAAWMVCFFCQFGNLGEVLHIRVFPSSLCHFSEPWVSHLVLLCVCVFVGLFMSKGEKIYFKLI
jgi:hypothetical protein